MLFNSYAFLLIYLPLVFIGFFALSRLRLTEAAKIWLLLASLFFYGYWDVRFIPLLLGSIAFNYMCGMGILSSQEPLRKKMFLSIGLIGDLCLLGYFKYSNFFLDSLGMETFADLALPLGISFFTFTQIAFLVDAYKGVIIEKGIISYSLFVTVFPHLIAGPILHHKEMLKQFNSRRMNVLCWNNIAQGIFLFTIGLSKKILIADNLVTIVKHVFDNTPAAIPFFQSWIGALAYTLQLYFDFSGYSDMAIGLGLLFNLRLPVNFNAPYQADSIIDFWRRWHITLSNFLRDYVYIPLGGSKQGHISKLRNLVITMVLGGLWHGAGWTFILWGAFHGILLVINHLWRLLKWEMPQLLARFLTLTAVIVGWVIFRSPTVSTAGNIISGMFGLNGIALPERFSSYLSALKTFGVFFYMPGEYNLGSNRYDVFLIMILIVAVAFVPASQHWLERFKKRPLIWSVPCAIAVYLSFIQLDNLTEFLYYQF